ncbi:YqcC family protein [Thiopseudomonas acetoxidans]|uniref:YqcC family protein n=1 Tax=Thiopseudomonas acetoxidans TaxID=3041622 RepID=A0ABT7SPV0_9GAMM|nr:YqcC family protein [Thiopseudomonas sp. CY1220]MDM7858222.1 YqcC family protein [Thiopseudomonas sp. CY1220]
MRELSSLADCLHCIEQQLRELGWWTQSPPNEQALLSQEPFCIDTLTFEQWLQWVLLPRMRIVLEKQVPLPSQSAIAEMADVVYAEQLGQTVALRRAIKQFDRLINKG